MRFIPVLLALFVSGCGQHFQMYKLAPHSSIRAVVSLSPSTTEIIASNGIVPTLKGRTASDNFPPNVSNVPEVASVKPDYEKIKAIAPDLIVYDSSVYGPGDIDKIKALGFRTFEIDAPNIGEFEKQLYQLGDIMGTQSNISDYVDRIDVALGSAAPKPNPAPRVAIIMPGDGGAPLIAGTKTFQASVFHDVGGIPVGPDTDKFVPLNAEVLISQNPDVIVVPTTKATGPHDIQEIANDPRLKSTNAVKHARIVAMDEDVALRRGTRVDHFVTGAYEAIATAGAH